jgi:hypothetical protein
MQATLDGPRVSIAPPELVGPLLHTIRFTNSWQPWGDDTSCETPDGCEQTVPTTETGWKNAYDVISDALTEVSVNGAPLSPIEAEPTDAAGIQDYWLADPAAPHRYHVDDALVFPTAADAIATAEPSEFTVSDAGLVGFSIRDSVTQDNLGGVSLEVTPVPEPPATPALAIGFAWLALHGRRPRSAGRARPALRAMRNTEANPVARAGWRTGSGFTCLMRSGHLA